LDPCFAVPDPLLAVQEFDRPTLQELALPRELGLLAFHRLPNFVRDLAGGAMRGHEPLFRHRRETLAEVGHPALDFAACLLFFRRPNRGLCPFLFEEDDWVLRLLFELGDSGGSLLVPSLEL